MSKKWDIRNTGDVVEGEKISKYIIGKSLTYKLVNGNAGFI